METSRRRSCTSSGCLSENKLRAMWLCQSLVTSDVSPASLLLGLEPRYRLPNEIRRQPSCRRSHLIDAPVCKLLEGGLHGSTPQGLIAVGRSVEAAGSSHR